MKFAKLFAMCLMSFSLALYACDNNENIDDENDGDKPNKPGDKTELPEFGSIRVTGITGTQASVSMLPTDKEATFIGQIFGYDYLYNEFGNDYDAMFQFALEYIDERFVSSSSDWLDFIYTGNQSLTYTGMDPNTRYIVLAAFVELDGSNLPKVTSKVGYKQFSTGEITADDYQSGYGFLTAMQGGDSYNYTTANAAYLINYRDLLYGDDATGVNIWMLYLDREVGDRLDEEVHLEYYTNKVDDPALADPTGEFNTKLDPFAEGSMYAPYMYMQNAFYYTIDGTGMIVDIDWWETLGGYWYLMDEDPNYGYGLVSLAGFIDGSFSVSRELGEDNEYIYTIAGKFTDRKEGTPATVSFSYTGPVTLLDAGAEDDEGVDAQTLSARLDAARAAKKQHKGIESVKSAHKFGEVVHIK